MSEVSAADLLIFNEFPQSLKRALSVCPRTPVFQAQVNGAALTDAVTLGAIAVNFDNVTLGAFGDIIPGMSLDFGTAAGLRNIGTVRVRETATASQIKIAETSLGKIPIVDNCFITIVDEFRPWQVMPRLVGTKINGSAYVNSFVEYHDYDDSYTDQNGDIEPKANVVRDFDSNGDPLPYRAAGYVDAGETFRTVELSANASEAFAPGAIITDVLWDVKDGTITVGSTTTANITVTFPATTTFRYCTLRVEDSNGTFHTMRFPIWVHDEENPPITRFKVTNDTRSEGREVTFDVLGDENEVTTAVIPKGTLVVYWEIAEFGDEEEQPDHYIDQFMGWITQDTVLLRLYQSRYSMNVAGPVYWLGHFDSFAQTLHQATANKWYRIVNLTMDRVTHYVLRSYCNILSLVNLYPTGLLEVALAEDIKKGTVWDQLVELLKAARMSGVGCDSMGAIWMRRHYSYLEQTDRDARVKVIELTPDKWADAQGVEITIENTAKTGIVNGAGSTIVSGKSKLYNSKAPGNVPDEAGGTEDMPFQRLPTVDTQLVLNQLTGHHEARTNNREPEKSIALVGNYDILEPCWNEPITLTDPAENIRGTELEEVEYLVRSVSVTHSGDAGAPPKVFTWTLEKVTHYSLPGITIIPKLDVVPIQMPTYTMPPLLFPGSNYLPPPFDQIFPPGETENPTIVPTNGNAVLVGTENGAWVSINFITSVVTYTEITPTGVTSSIVHGIWGNGREVYLLETDGLSSWVWYSADPFIAVPIWVQSEEIEGEYYFLRAGSAAGEVYVRGAVDGGLEGCFPEIDLGIGENLQDRSGDLGEGWWSVDTIGTPGGPSPECYAQIEIPGCCHLTAYAMPGMTNAPPGNRVAWSCDDTEEGYSHTGDYGLGGPCLRQILFRSFDLGEVQFQLDAGEDCDGGGGSGGTVIFSDDHGATFGSPEIFVMLDGGMDTIKAGPQILAGEGGQVELAETGGNFANYGDSMPTDAAPSAIWIPRCQFATSNPTNVNDSTPNYLVASASLSDPDEDSLWRVDTNGTNFANITPSISGDRYQAVGPNCIAMPWATGVRIAAIGLFDTTRRLVVTITTGGTWLNRGDLSDDANYVRYRRSGTNLNQLYIADGRPRYSGNHGVTIINKAHPDPAGIVAAPLLFIEPY
jgi:hypothetical protein